MAKSNGQPRSLVVEDEPSIAKMCIRVLKSADFEVDIAIDGKEAQTRFSESGDIYDLCLIDIRTPGMNGIELYDYLADIGSDMINRVIFTTGDVINDEIKAFLEKTGRPFLPKPFTPNELRSAIKKSLALAPAGKSR